MWLVSSFVNVRNSTQKWLSECRQTIEMTSSMAKTDKAVNECGFGWSFIGLPFSVAPMERGWKWLVVVVAWQQKWNACCDVLSNAGGHSNPCKSMVSMRAHHGLACPTKHALQCHLKVGIQSPRCESAERGSENRRIDLLGPLCFVQGLVSKSL